MTNNEPIPVHSSIPGGGTLVPAGTNLGDSNLDVNYRFYPLWIIPRWVLGLEINISSFKITFEASTVFTRIKDSFTAQIGFRGDL